MRTLLFHRDFWGFTGGHLKIWNYFNHAETAANWQPKIYFSPNSVWDDSNPWQHRRTDVLPVWQPEQADALFLGGYDWRAVPSTERAHHPKPILNLIQHVHHADPAHPLSEFLSHRAIRICVSEEVRAAIEATGRVNGLTVVIPNGIDFGDLPTPSEPTTDWLICGLKDGTSVVTKSLARRLNAQGDWGRVETLTKLLPRAEFLARLAQARRAVLLPRAMEGFYLPALEAMALGRLVVCPDCVGNRSFCRDGDTAIVPASGAEDDLLAALNRARRLPHDQEATIVQNARTVAAAYTLERERSAFHELLATLPSLW